MDAIAQCGQVQDSTNHGILQDMIRSEEEHVDWPETQCDTINIIGIDLWLNQQIPEE